MTRPHRLIALVATGAALAGSVAAMLPAAAAAAPSCAANLANTRMVCTFSAQGADSFTVPAGVRHVWITAVGGGGGGGGTVSSFVSDWNSRGGNGATVVASNVPVQPSENGWNNTLSVYVGGPGANGGSTQAGGGGGATKVWGATSWDAPGRPFRQSDITIVAGGGGGAGSMGAAGGAGTAGQSLTGKGGNGTLGGYAGRCAGGGGGGLTAAGGGGIIDGDTTVAYCLAGRSGYAGSGGSADGAGGAGPDGTSGGGGGGRAGVFGGSSATGGGGGGGWGGGAGGYLGGGGGAGGSTVMSQLSLSGVSIAYQSDAGNGGIGAGNVAAGAGWVQISYPLQTQTITLTSDPATSSNWRVGRTYTLQATGGASGNPIEWTLDRSSGCTLSGTVLTFTHYNYCTVTATQAGTQDYLDADLVVQSSNSSGVVWPGTQAITYTSSAVGHAVDGTYTPTASGGGSGNPVTFSVSGASSGVCTMSGSTITFDHVGTCTVLADQAASPLTSWDYFAAPQTQQVITVAKAAQPITFTTSAPSPTFGDATSYSPAATGGRSGNAVVLSVNAAAIGVCTLSGGNVTFQHAGTCLIDSSQAGNDDYLAGTAQQSITIARAAQAVAITSIAPSPTYGDASSYTPTTTGGGSGNARSIAIATGSSGVCTATAGTITFQHAGTCLITADQTGNGDYLPASQAQQTITVAKRPQAIAFTNDAGGMPRVRDTYTPAASDGGSGLARVFAIDASSSGVCSIAAGVVTFNHVGTCRVNVTQPGDDDHLPAPHVQQAITVEKAIQLIAISSSAPSPTFGDASTYTPIYGGGYSNQPLALAVAGASSGVCTLTSGTVTFQHAGTCTLTLNRGGDDDYLAAAQATQDITVAKAPQVVAFTTTANSAVVDGTYTPTASGGGSGIARAFTLTSGSLPYCSLADGIVTFNHVGICTINVNQAGDDDHLPAPQIQQAITIGRATQIVVFTGEAPAPTYGDSSTYTPTLFGGRSTQPSIITVNGPSAGICSIAAGIVTFQHAGTCVLNVDRAGDSDYFAAPQQQRTITVARAAQSIAFTSSAPAPTYGDASSYTPTTTGGGSGNARSVAIAAGSSGVCSITAGTITFQHAGSCVVTADQSGTDDYLAAPQALQTITVARQPQAIAFTTTAPQPAFGDATTYAPAVTGGSSGNAVVLAAVGSPADTCVDTEGTITFPHGGTCTITATQAETADYLAAPTVQQVITVQPIAQTIAFTSTPPTGAVATGDGYRPTTDGGARGTTIELVAGGACLLRGDAVAPISAGICTVTARRPASRDFTAAEATQTYVVGPAPVTTQTAVSATPRTAGSAVISTATVSWPASAFTTPVTVNVTTVASPTMSFAAGQQPIRLSIRDASGTEITSFNRPLELVFGKASGIPGYSRDGRTWTAMPELTGTTLPEGYRDGWYRAADGTIHVLTLHATDFGVLKAGAKVRSALTLTVKAPASVAAAIARVTATVTTSLPAKTTFVLRTANGTRVTLRTTSAKASRSTVVQLDIPARLRKPGRCTLIISATAGRESVIVQRPLRLVR